MALNLKYAEVKITEHCNLKCKMCANYSNIAYEEEYGLKEYKRDFSQLERLDITIEKLRLIGGEPLLSHNIIRYIEISRKHQPKAEIHLLTNGLLLDEISDEFFEALKIYDVILQFSNYPDSENQEKKDCGKRVLEEKKVNYFEYKPDFFEVDYQFEKDKDDTKEVFGKCNYVYDMLNIYRGWIYKCPRPISLRHYDRMYGTDYSDMEDGINLFDPATTHETIVEYLNHPIKSCKYCSKYKGFALWDKNNIEQSQWNNDRNNPFILLNMSKEDLVQSGALKKMKYMYLNIENGKKDFGEKALKDILSIDGKRYIWLSDPFNIDRFHFLYDLLKKYLYEIEGICVSDDGSVEWVREDILCKTFEIVELLEKKEHSIVFVLSSNPKRIIRELTKLLRG